MGKITKALKKAASDRLSRMEKLDEKGEVRYEFVAQKTVDSDIDPRIVTFYDPLSPVTEQYRTFRTNLQSIRKDNKPMRVITITSSTHSEGKTITAINLAVSMAQDMSKKKILLVDADLRRARLDHYLGIESDMGLADLVTDGARVDDVLLNVGIDNLTVLPAGKLPHNPADILGSNKMKNLIAALRAKYDYVIFDTPPVISVTDAGLVGALTDGVLVVVKASKTQRGVVKHSEALLRQAQARLLGYVLTNIEYHIPAYIYRYL
ncbi:MAG: CpsD/CapB family tyrosine-protein kinase [Candidatus Omnitrophica bacterium]|nr:CpsD/CapB family tyrosine-protein kinase [Candidatus Omnitrophota bacterium]